MLGDKLLKMSTKLLRKFSSNIEYFALISGIIVFLAIYIKNYMSYLFLSLAATVGVLLFIVFKKYFTNTDLNERSCTYLFTPYKHVFSVIFFTFYALSFTSLLDGFYTKTIWYYAFVSICTASIAMDIFFLDSKTTYKSTLFKCVLLFLNLSISNQILYPLGIGNPDNFFHVYSITLPIIETGKIPIGYVYSNFPMHHLLVVSIYYFIQQYPPLMIYNYLGALIMSLSPLPIFLLGRKIVDTRFGLLSSLLYCCCDYLIYWGSHPAHLSFMYSIILVIFFLLLRILSEKKSHITILCIIMSIYVVFLHHYSAMIMFFILISVLIVELCLKIQIKDYKVKSFGLLRIFILILLSHWMFYSSMFGRFVNIVDLYVKAFSGDFMTYAMSNTYYDTLPLGNLLLNEVGSSIFLCLSVIGLFYFIHHRSLFSDIVSFLFVVFLLLIGFGSFLNLYYLLPNRIYAFMQEISMIFLASASILWILGNLNYHNNAKKISVVLLILVIQLFSASSTIAGLETSPLIGEQPYWKIYETHYERNSLLWIQKNYNSDIVNSTISASPSVVLNPEIVNKLTIPYTEYIYYENKNDIIVDIENVSLNSYIIYNKFDEIAGFNFGRMNGSKYHMGSSKKAKTNSITEQNLEFNPKILQIYNNGMIVVYEK